MDLRQQLVPSRGPLPPQRWGFLPTEQFWSLASFTPISFVFWLGAAFFYDWLVSLGWSWWQNGLGCVVFTAVWAGLVERWSRKYLARRRLQALTSPDELLSETRDDLVPAPEPQQGLPVFATHEFWDYAFARWFGRAKGVASMLFEFVFFMAAFYPSWKVFFGSLFLLILMSLGLGRWQRRLIRAQLPRGAQVDPTLAAPPRSASGRPPQLPDSVSAE